MSHIKNLTKNIIEFYTSKQIGVRICEKPSISTSVTKIKQFIAKNNIIALETHRRTKMFQFISEHFITKEQNILEVVNVNEISDQMLPELLKRLKETEKKIMFLYDHFLPAKIHFFLAVVCLMPIPKLNMLTSLKPNNSLEHNSEVLRKGYSLGSMHIDEDCLFFDKGSILEPEAHLKHSFHWLGFEQLVTDDKEIGLSIGLSPSQITTFEEQGLCNTPKKMVAWFSNPITPHHLYRLLTTMSSKLALYTEQPLALLIGEEVKHVQESCFIEMEFIKEQFATILKQQNQ